VESKVNTSFECRENAENCDELAVNAQNGPSRRRLERLAKGWRAVAETQDWLDGAMPPVGIWEEEKITADGVPGQKPKDQPRHRVD
jgi:hypothetical protein